MTKQIDYNEFTKEELIKELIKVNKELATTSRLLRKFSTDEILKDYISNDEHIKTIVKMFKSTQDTLHKGTLKRFATDTKKKLILEDMYENKAHKNNVDKKLYDTMSPNTFDKKIRELKVLRLVKEEEGDYSISITDKLATLIKSNKNKTEYQKQNGVRVTRSTKDESELKFESEDKIIASRLRVPDINENMEEEFEKFERYKYIYKLNYNTFMIARKIKETEEDLKKRIELVLEQLDTIENGYFRNYKYEYIEKQNKLYKVVYDKKHSDFETFLKAHNTTKSPDKEKLRKQLQIYYKTLKYKIFTKDIKLEEVEKYKVQSELDTSEMILLKTERVIYIHESISKNIENYIKNRIKALTVSIYSGAEVKVIKYRT